VSLDWPAGFDRTDPADRESTTRFDSTRSDTKDDFRKTLRLMGVDQYRVAVDSGGRYVCGDGYPKHGANPDDPGAVVRWRRDGSEYAVACDHYDDVDDNLRSIYLWLEETRKRNDRPVVTGASGFAAAALPDAEAEPADPPAHEVLGVRPDAPPEVVEGAARARIQQTHPDKPGGDREAFQRVQRAKEQLLDDS
jgi:hypothetical protein